MANAEKFEAKLKALRDKLQTYGHVPSVAEDRAINANVKYYYKNYANHPLVIKLMNDFPLNIGERGSYKKHPDIESRVLSIEEQLITLGRIDEMADLQLREGMVVPEHVAIILDGNGRWAKKRGLKRLV